MDMTSLRQLHAGHNLRAILAQIEARIRQQPGDDANRWALVEMLCVLGQWERALRQAQATAKLSDKWQPNAHLIRGLIRAEHMRGEVFAGKQIPVPVIDHPQWMQHLASALTHNAQGRPDDADSERRLALEQAPTHAGVCAWQHRPSANAQAGNAAGSVQVAPNADRLPAWEEQAYTWIGDSDTRLGPVCEVMVAGGYRWLAFADIERLDIDPPSRLLDLVWLPARLRLRGTQSANRDIHCFLPTRYCGTESARPELGQEQHDALLLSRLTTWTDVGETGVFASGQKTWMTEGTDWSMLDIRTLRDADTTEDTARAGKPASDGESA